VLLKIFRFQIAGKVPLVEVVGERVVASKSMVLREGKEVAKNALKVVVQRARELILSLNMARWKMMRLSENFGNRDHKARSIS
jgi:hypothetical protein